MVRLLEQCREASVEPVTEAAFREWLLNHRLDRRKKDGRPPVVQIRQHVLMALFFLRFALKPCKVAAAARDIWDSFEVEILSPHQHEGERSRHINSAESLAVEIRSGRYQCGPKAVLWIMLWLIEHREESGEFRGASFECRPAGGGLGEVVSIMPKQPAVLAGWIDAWLEGFSAGDGILNLARHAQACLEQEFVAAKRSSGKIFSQ